MKRKLALSAISVAVALLAGCSLTPGTSSPGPAVPASFPTGPAYPAAPAGATSGPVPDLPWEEYFPDERLQKVIGLAIAGNQDLRIAAVNVERARAIYGVQETRSLPSASADASSRSSRTSADLSATGRPDTGTTYTVDLASVQWEIDLFGRLGHLSDAALEAYFATREARRAAQVLLVSGVAGAWLTLAADRDDLRLAKSTLETQQDALEIVRHRVEGGLSPALDLHLA
jgi:multidrug efflux system outer membrane protein